MLRSKLVRQGLSKGLQFIPGVGPIASSAFDAAAPMLQRAIAQRRHVAPAMRLAPDDDDDGIDPAELAAFMRWRAMQGA